MKTKLRRGVVAVAAALSCLLLPASPASAVTTDVETTGGTIVAAKAGLTTQVLALAPGSCVPYTFQIDTTATTAGIPSVSMVRQITWSMGTYIAVFTRTGGTTGTATGSTPATLAGMGLTLQVRMYTLASTCTAGTLLCTWNMSHTVSGLFSGNPAAPASGDTAILNSPGATLTLGGACAAPFTTYTGGTMRIAGLTLSVP